VLVIAAREEDAIVIEQALVHQLDRVQEWREWRERPHLELVELGGHLVLADKPEAG
jgi:hypothetical protein